MMRSPTANRPAKGPWAGIALALLVGTGLEAGGYGLLHLARRLDPRAIRLSDERILALFEEQRAKPGFGESWDSVLGWDNRPNARRERVARRPRADRRTVEISFDAEGARSNPAFAGQPTFAATYGDSFTAGNEVNDDETWQSYLSAHLGRYVANYGVSAYGTDQAVLKYKIKHADRPAAPVVILTIWEDNIARLFSRYRPFYSHAPDPILGFKPMYTIHDGRPTIVGNPASEAPFDRRSFLTALAAAKHGDRWYAGQTAIAFPYFVHAARATAILVARELDLGPWDLGFLPSDLWRDEHTAGVMRAVTEDFIATAHARGALPVVQFLPSAATIGKERPWRPGYAPLLSELRRDHRSDATLLVDIAETGFDAARFNVRPFSGHTSPYGNQVIAARLAEVLRETSSVGASAIADRPSPASSPVSPPAATPSG